QCAQLINDGATVLPMVPVTARLLAARGTRTIRRDHRLRLAMVGAGPVNDELETCFRRGLGMGLARNYGSTETGALFSAGPGSPAGCVGHPLDGVEFRIVDNSGAELSPGNSGELVVRLDGGPWHPMGDLAVYQEDGLRPLGRRTRAFRRGDRWVAPEEIEAALLRHPDVVDARAFVEIRGRGGGTTIHAEVVHTRGIPASAEALRAHARTELAAHKVPDRIRLVGDLPRSSVGKPIPPRRIVLADADTLIACAQAYKRSELLFALLRLGVLERLVRGPATPAEVATALGVDREVCEQLMRVAEHVGLLQAEPPPGDPPVEHSPTGSEAADEAMRILRLEELLSRSWVTRERLTELGDTGMTHRAFDRDGPTEQLLTAYQQVMHSPAAYRRTRLGLSLAGDRRGARILEITCGPGRYIECAGSSTGSLCRVGPFAAASGGLSDIESLDTGQRFDLVVVCNAIHLPGPGSDLRLLARLLASTGRLLVDDVFMEVPAGLRNEVWLDWLTHGGVAWPTESSLLLGLARVGLTVERTVHVGRPACTVLLASIPGREADAATGVRLS
ncbi:MAG: fatty acid--CoA ligase family protein, partial [Pseudonocardiaceae bacterium]